MGQKGQDYEYIDSDDDDNNNDMMMIKILARNGPYKKQIKKIVPEKPLITYLLKKDENSQKEPKPKFLPYKSTKSDVHNPFKELTRCQKLKKFEITAATPPPSINGPVKCLTLLESLALQKEQEEHRKKEIQSDDENENDEEVEVYDDEDENNAGTIRYTVTEYLS
ncbi:uncharacterized protein LOC113378324 [Ctenocephalides felis]|uniref:uncharacterized protein LOC113378324 n=1 Tax=Ctenocephalides felis TaxID=7515 RepID=UPI000E6E3B16|nr:uncharacterized protein LOC113378324 [Ctenocephalides felis]